MSVLISESKNIFDLLSMQEIEPEAKSVEFIDNHFINLLTKVENFISEQNYDFVFHILADLITKENNLRVNQENNFINGQDLNKVILYEINNFHHSIIESFNNEIINSNCDYHNMLQFSSFLAKNMKINSLNKIKEFIANLSEIRYLNEPLINHYIAKLNQTFQTFFQ